VPDLEQCGFNNQFPFCSCSASINYKVLLTLVSFHWSDKYVGKFLLNLLYLFAYFSSKRKWETGKCPDSQCEI
jgi:hypothetical protein